MSAAKKARKKQQREQGTPYQHPTREGIPYGRSKQPSMTGLNIDEQQLRVIRSMVHSQAGQGRKTS